MAHSWKYLLSKYIPGTKAYHFAKVSSGISWATNSWVKENSYKLSDPKTRAEEFYRSYISDPRITQVVDDTCVGLDADNWEIIPADDSSEAQKVARLVGACLLNQNDKEYGQEYWMRPLWRKFLWEVGFSLCVYGFGVWAKKYNPVGGAIVYDDLIFIEPATIAEWKVDDEDNLISIVRNYTNGAGESITDEEIPAAELFMVAYRAVGSNFVGIPLIRSLYGSFIRKEFLQKLAMVASKRRLLPIPAWQIPEGIDPDSDEYKRMSQFLQALTDPDVDNAFIMAEVLPQFLDSGNIQIFQEMANWIERENNEIAAGGRTQALLKGENNVGSHALAEVINQRETRGLQAFNKIVADQITFGAKNSIDGLVQDLVNRNFPSAPLPRLIHKPDRTAESIEISKMVGDLISKKVLPALPVLQKHILDNLGIEIDLKELEGAAEEKKQIAQQIQNATSQEGEEPTEEETQGEQQPPETSSDDE